MGESLTYFTANYKINCVHGTYMLQGFPHKTDISPSLPSSTQEFMSTQFPLGRDYP